MEIKELGHVVLYVKDAQRSAEFYGKVLGWKRLPSPSLGAAIFSSGRTHHELLLIEVGAQAQPVPKGRRLGLYHIGLKVGDTDEELRDALKQVQEAGVTIVGASDHTVTHSLYILDPDGNEIELYVDVPEVDWKKEPEAIMAPTRPLRLYETC